MKTPIRPAAKAKTTKAASAKKSAAEQAIVTVVPFPKLAIANMPYNASDKRAIEKNNAPKQVPEPKAAPK